MSKLISGLKSGVNFGGGINIFVPKKLDHDYRMKKLKNFHQTKSLSSTIKASIRFFVYDHIDMNTDLYNQIRYDTQVIEFINYQKMIEETITLKEFKEKFIEIKVHNWHIIYCLSKIFKSNRIKDSTDNMNFFEEIIDYNFRNLINNNVTSEVDYTIKISSIDEIDSKILKTFHGTGSILTNIQWCILFYEHTKFKSHYISNSLKAAGDIIHINPLEKSNLKSLHQIKLPERLEDTINLREDKINDITSIINFNIEVYYNLFPEQRWK